MKPLIEILLLAAGVAAVVVSGAGLMRMRAAMEQLHYLAFASLVGAPLFAAAACVHQGWSPSSAKVLLILALLLVQAPVMTHAVGRAIYRTEVEPRRHKGGRA